MSKAKTLIMSEDCFIAIRDLDFHILHLLIFRHNHK